MFEMLTSGSQFDLADPNIVQDCYENGVISR